MPLTFPTAINTNTVDPFYGESGIVRANEMHDQKRCIVYAAFDAAYLAGGEVLNLQAAPFDVDNHAFFSQVIKVICGAPLTTAQNAFPARATCCRVAYLPTLNGDGDEWAPTTGRLVAYAENAYCCEVEVAGQVDLSTVLVPLEIIGG